MHRAELCGDTFPVSLSFMAWERASISNLVRSKLLPFINRERERGGRELVEGVVMERREWVEGVVNSVPYLGSGSTGHGSYHLILFFILYIIYHSFPRLNGNCFLILILILIFCCNNTTKSLPTLCPQHFIPSFPRFALGFHLIRWIMSLLNFFRHFGPREGKIYTGKRYCPWHNGNTNNPTKPRGFSL